VAGRDHLSDSKSGEKYVTTLRGTTMPAIVFTAWSASVIAMSALGLMTTRRPAAAPVVQQHAPAPPPVGQYMTNRRVSDHELVYITDPTGRVIRGWVLSRSADGFRLQIEWHIATGTPIQVQATDGLGGVGPPVAVTVWRCRPMDVLYEIGCRYTHRPRGADC
jgi:hypothetical protein